jgi:hypothetical protein
MPEEGDIEMSSVVDSEDASFNRQYGEVRIDREEYLQETDSQFFFSYAPAAEMSASSGLAPVWTVEITFVFPRRALNSLA